MKNRDNLFLILDEFMYRVSPDFNSLHDEVLLVCDSKLWHQLKKAYVECKENDNSNEDV